MGVITMAVMNVPPTASRVATFFFGWPPSGVSADDHLEPTDPTKLHHSGTQLLEVCRCRGRGGQSIGRWTDGGGSLER